MSSKRKEITKYDQGIIETHCHLDYLKEDSLEVILDRCRDYFIEKIVTISVDPQNLKIVRDLCEKYPQVYGTQGVHPHDAKDVTAEVLSEIENSLKLPKIIAVGEIGLDYHYNHSPRDKQIDAFERQLEIACRYDRPVVIHTREADDDTKDILKNFSSKLKAKGVVHSFTSSLALAEFCLNEDFYLGFNGIITFNKAQNIRDVLNITPLERILIETDAPFLTPIPYRGKENAPYYLPFIAEKIALEKNIEISEVLKQTKKNAIDLFHL